MIFTLNCIFIILFCFWVGYRFRQPFNTAWFTTTLLLKLAAGIVLGLIYRELGSGDTLHFYHEGIEIAQRSDNSWLAYFERLTTANYPEYKGEARTEFFTKLLSPFLILTNNNYWLTAIYLSLINFLCTWFFIRALLKIFPDLKWPALISFMLVPSVVFWSSGILKDSLANGMTFLLFAFAITYDTNRKIRIWEYFLAAIALVLVIKLKFYVGALVILGLSLIVLIRIVSTFIRGNVAWVMLGMLGVGSLYLVSLIDYNLHLSHLPLSIYENNQAILKASDPGQAISFTMEPSWISLLINAPQFLLYGLFGPFPFQGNPYNIIYWLENITLLILIFFNFKLLFIEKVQPRFHKLFWFAICFVLVLATFLPMSSPNFGTLTRYKAVYLPLLFMFLSYLPIQKMLKKTFSQSNISK